MYTLYKKILTFNWIPQSTFYVGHPNCKFGIGFHASHFPMMKGLHGDDYVEVFENVTADVFLYNSIAEPDENSAGGLADSILGDLFHSKDYEQRHGWVVRGNLSEEAVAADVDDALELALAFALEHK